ncbi:MAG: hypothetical protein WC780_13285 [Lentimicrobiaceae bacterium]|jgi:hypothetical protein
MQNNNINIYHATLLMLFPFTWILYYLENYNASIFSSIIICLFIYNFSKAKFHLKQVWLSHPLRLMIPLTLIMQSLWWITFLLYSNSITFFNYEWVFDYHSNEKYIPHAYASFLLLISVYFYSLAIFYNPKKLFINERLKISSNKILYIIVFFILVISLFDYILVYASLSKIEFFPALNYIFKLFAKLRPLFSLVLIYFLWHKNTRLAKIILFLYLSIYLFIGFIGVNLTSMRQIIFEPIIITIIFFYTIRHKIHLNLSRLLIIASFIIVGFYVFIVASSIKFGETNIHVDDNKSIGYRSLASFQQFIFRSTLYSADVIALSNPASEQLLKKNGNDVLVEIASGVPFGGILVPKSQKTFYPIDMQFFWSYLPIGISSAYVSGTTSLWFLFGIPMAMLFIFFIGLFHGEIFQLITTLLGTKYSWLVIFSMTSLFPFYGLQRSDLLGLPIYCLLGAFILKKFFIKKSSSNNNVINTLND